MLIISTLIINRLGIFIGYLLRAILLAFSTLIEKGELEYKKENATSRVEELLVFFFVKGFLVFLKPLFSDICS